MGTDAIPPRAAGPAARLLLGPALRAQPDRRLVRLVREGYEGAFEEIVRRYRRPLGRFAASIVGGRHEDVTQDSFRKALEALRGGDAEIELRPWLYRIVRNTALSDLRDQPAAAAELVDELVVGGRSAAAEAEEREELARLIDRLRALPENQRAALLLRELDGMSHEEIATALGISKGAARQAIARGRAAVRSGFGAFLPLPLLRSLLDGAAATEAGVGAGTTGVAGATGAAATAIGTGGAGALKIGLATVVVAGSLGAGVAIDHSGHTRHSRPDHVVERADDGSTRVTGAEEAGPSAATIDDADHDGAFEPGDDDRHRSRGSGDDRHGRDDRHSRYDDHGRGDNHHRGDNHRDDKPGDDGATSGRAESISDDNGTSGGPGPSDSSGPGNSSSSGDSRGSRQVSGGESGARDGSSGGDSISGGGGAAPAGSGSGSNSGGGEDSSGGSGGSGSGSGGS